MIIIYFCIFLALIATVNGVVLFKQGSSTSCTSFKNFNRGKNQNVGGETCEQADDGLRIFKPANSGRAELRGIKRLEFQKDKKYYIAWDFMVSSTVTNNAIFQWKAYGSPMKQNFPIVIKIVNGELVLAQFQDPTAGLRRENVLFRKRLSANQWYSNMLAIRVSDQNQGGSVEYWFDGYQQDLLAHGESTKVWPCRTFDGSLVDPKFGIYGAHGTDVHSSLRNLLIGEELQDMNYDKGSSAAAGAVVPSPAITVFSTVVFSTLAVVKGIFNTRGSISRD